MSCKEDQHFFLFIFWLGSGSVRLRESGKGGWKLREASISLVEEDIGLAEKVY